MGLDEFSTSRLDRSNLGYLLARASHRWNELLYDRFCRAGWRQVRPAYGAVLVPLFEEDGLQMGELARRAGSSKQAMTTLVRKLEASGLVRRAPDPEDGRAFRIWLSRAAQDFRPVAERAVAELEALVRSVGTKRATAQARSWLARVIAIEA